MRNELQNSFDRASALVGVQIQQISTQFARQANQNAQHKVLAKKVWQPHNT